MTARTFALTALASLTLSLVATQAQTQAFPSKPVRIVVAYPAGGSVDNISRAVTPRLGTILDQPVVIENKAGGVTLQDLGGCHCGGARQAGRVELRDDRARRLKSYQHGSVREHDGIEVDAGALSRRRTGNRRPAGRARAVGVPKLAASGSGHSIGPHPRDCGGQQSAAQAAPERTDRRGE